MTYIYIIRYCLIPLRNPLTIDNLPIFLLFEDAHQEVSEYINLHKFKKSDSTKFNDNNRYYVYEDFIDEQFIWIERFNLN